MEQVASDYPILVRKSNNGIYRISYPLVYRIHNSSTKRYRIRVNYYYGNPTYSYSLESEWSPVFILRNFNNRIIRATERGRLIIEGLETKEYIVYPGHGVPEEDSLRCLLETESCELVYKSYRCPLYSNRFERRGKRFNVS